jgi:hypothetical protein
LSAGFGESRQKNLMTIGTIVDVFGETIGIIRWGKMCTTNAGGLGECNAEISSPRLPEDMELGGECMIPIDDGEPR